MYFLCAEWGQLPSQILDGMTSLELSEAEAYYRRKRKREEQAMSEARAAARATKTRRLF